MVRARRRLREHALRVDAQLRAGADADLHARALQALGSVVRLLQKDAVRRGAASSGGGGGAHEGELHELVGRG